MPKHIQLFVEDNGSGINQSLLKNLFELKSSKKKTSFGLHLCKELLTLMGGEITAKSISEVGTTMIITLNRFHSVN